MSHLAQTARDPDLLDFAPPADPDSDREALEERAAIIAEGCGMGPSQALQEVRWQADRERAWRAFLVNAKRILAGSEGQRAALMDRYRVEATNHYGEATAATMAGTMHDWIEARAEER